MQQLSYEGALCTSFCVVLAKHHDFNLAKLTKVESERLLSFIGISTFDKYPELKGGDERLLATCKSESVKRIYELNALLNDNPSSSFELNFA